MTQINNYQNYNPAFYGMSPKDVKKEMPEQEKNDKMLKFIGKCSDVLNEMAERQVPENNKFRKIFVAFDIPKTRNEAFISISHDEIEPKTLRRVAVQVHHSNSDKFYSKYIFKGTKKECMNFIADTNNHKKMLDNVFELSKRVDEDYD